MHLEISNIDVHALLLPLIGFIVGLFSGLLGLGGGWLVTPTLNIIGMGPALAVGTSLTQMVGTSLMAVAKHSRSKQVEWRLGLAFGLPVVVGVMVGRELMLAAGPDGGTILRYAYVILLTTIGTLIIRGLIKSHRQVPTKTELPALLLRPEWRYGPQVPLQNATVISAYLIVAIGVLSGLLSGLLGIGGGLILMPILTYGVGLSTVRAVGTSLVCVLIGAIFGTLSYTVAGSVDYQAAGSILVGSLAGSYLGAGLAGSAPDHQLKGIFAALILCTASSVALKEVNLVELARYWLFASAGGFGLVTLVYLLYQRRKLASLE